MNIDTLIASWEDKRTANAENFKKHFGKSDDLLAIVLRGHLLIEGFLDELNRHCFHSRSFYDEAHLTFHKKLLIARAQIIEPGPSIFQAVKALNELRNNLAHNLESQKLTEQLERFLADVEPRYSEELSAGYSCLEFTLEERVQSAIAFILGTLQILDHVVEFMENSRSYGGGDSKQGDANRTASTEI